MRTCVVLLVGAAAIAAPAARGQARIEAAPLVTPFSAGKPGAVLIEKLADEEIDWYWMDVQAPSDEEICFIREHFPFHPLAIEDCLYHKERPKVDYDEQYIFFVLSAINSETLESTDLDIFVGSNYIVTFHKEKLSEVDSVRDRLLGTGCAEGRLHVVYLLFDKIVDQYFPAIYRIEDDLSGIVIRSGQQQVDREMNLVFDLRNDLLKLRRTVNAMKELLYRILNSERLVNFRGNKLYYNDIYDHLLKLSDTIESSREITADMRDSYISITSHRTNRIMTILTIISSIFIPLTFIVGIYGMNFDYMPELRWRGGYYLIIAIMAAVGIGMLLWFKRKGWLNLK
jgi:magnesium transporter